jgi:Putative prokaryotic signal transducing protein
LSDPKTLYEASNAVEAQMLVDLLKQQGFAAQVHGAHLSGAMGELPLGGLVRLVIAPEDHARARAVIDAWETSQPAQAPVEARAASRLSGLHFLGLGILIGAAFGYAFFRVPISVSGVDNNHDGALDERWHYSASGAPVKYEADRNLDGKVDYVQQYDARGNVESATSDDDFNGSFESSHRYRNGNNEVSETDSDGNGIPDVRWTYENGVLATVETILATSGRPVRIDRFKLGVRVSADVDTDNDGGLDTRILFSPTGAEQSRSAIRP